MTNKNLPVVFSGLLDAERTTLLNRILNNREKRRLDESLVPENLAPSVDALPDLPDPFPLWRMTEQAA